MGTPARNRVARLAVGLPAVFLSWALLVGLPPLARTPTGHGHLVAHTMKLTGPGAAGRATTTRAADRAWTATVSVDAHTQSVSLSWSGAPFGSASVRSRSAGRWSSWTTDTAEPDEGPNRGGNGRSGIGPICSVMVGATPSRFGSCAARSPISRSMRCTGSDRLVAASPPPGPTRRRRRSTFRASGAAAVGRPTIRAVRALRWSWAT